MKILLVRHKIPSDCKKPGISDLIGFYTIKFIDPDDSIALNPNEIPMVTFRQRITKAGFRLDHRDLNG